MAFNYSKLRGRIREKCGSDSNFAKKLGCNHGTLSYKLNNISEFSQSEILKAIRILDIKESEISDYFFAL
ncbi:MAG: DUF739 family protein [Ruminococcus sp.]|nr:DUF739 family protein [Ruminococcus sp.]